MTAIAASPSAAAPSAAANPRARRFYAPELDVLRFFAFFGVFCFHALPSDYAGLTPRLGHSLPALLQAARDALAFGVPMFFLLSSYLITRLLTLEREATGTIHMRSFYLRRMLRIWPLYLAFLLAMWGLGRAGVFFPIERGRFLAFLLFSGNIYTGLFGFTFNPILPLWTISIEEQFYIVWPALARAGTRLLRGAALATVALSVVATVCLRLFSAQPTLAVWTSSLQHFQFFALGALLALGFGNRVPYYSARLRCGFALLGAVLLLVAAGPLHINGAAPAVSAPLLALGYELMAAGVVLLFLAVIGVARGRRQLPAALVYLGKISYGLYVFHELALQVCGRLAHRYNLHMGFRTLGAAALTVGLSMLSYRFFEKPFLLLKDRFAFVQSRPA